MALHTHTHQGTYYYYNTIAVQCQRLSRNTECPSFSVYTCLRAIYRGSRFNGSTKNIKRTNRFDCNFGLCFIMRSFYVNYFNITYRYRGGLSISFWEVRLLVNNVIILRLVFFLASDSFYYYINKKY